MTHIPVFVQPEQRFRGNKTPFWFPEQNKHEIRTNAFQNVEKCNDVDRTQTHTPTATAHTIQPIRHQDNQRKCCLYSAYEVNVPHVHEESDDSIQYENCSFNKAQGNLLMVFHSTWTLAFVILMKKEFVENGHTLLKKSVFCPYISSFWFSL